MKLVFLTNQASYHQMHFARALVAEIGANNVRIVFQKGTSAARAEMGWQDDYTEPYIIRFEESDVAKRNALGWINEADVVIQGRFPITHLRQRINAGKLTFTCQERLWKKPPSWRRKLSRAAHLYKNYYSVNRPNYHFLAIGAFAASDLNSMGLFIGRSWRYGYFIDAPQAPSPTHTDSQSLQLLWCARFSDVKQPHKALEILGGLKHRGLSVQLTMVGDGALRGAITAQAKRMGLSDRVTFTGWQTQTDVFAHMARSDLFLMTSHHGEGWGLVVNEAMSCGCAVMANRLLGSAQCLIQSGSNGLLYDDDNLENIIDQIQTMDKHGVRQLGKQANQTMVTSWSASVAAKRTIALSNALLSGNIDEAKTLYDEGVCAHLQSHQFTVTSIYNHIHL